MQACADRKQTLQVRDYLTLSYVLSCAYPEVEDQPLKMEQPQGLSPYAKGAMSSALGILAGVRTGWRTAAWNL